MLDRYLGVNQHRPRHHCGGRGWSADGQGVFIRVGPSFAIEMGRVGGIAVLNLEGIFSG
jgi:hypothetical protein